MGNSSTTAKANRQNQELTLQHTQTDSPLLPVAQLERLHTFRPDLVDFVIKQTEIEAAHRRAEQKRIGTFVFINKTGGQIFAFLLGLAGLAYGSHVALNGQPWAGATIATVCLTGLAVGFITRLTR